MMAAPPQRHTDRAQRAERDAKIFRMRIAGMTMRQIAAEVGLSQARVCEIIQTEIRDLVEPEVEELRKLAAARLDDQRRTAYAVRSRRHFVVQGGKIVHGPDGQPLIDDGPVLAANDQLRKIEERAAKLFGLDAPEALEIALERRNEEEAEHTVTAVEAVAAVLGLTGERRMLALEAAAAGLAGEPLPEPSEPEQATEHPPWPVMIEGREYQWDARRKCYRELGLEYRPGEGGEIIVDAEFVEGDLTDDQDATGPGVPDDDPEALRLELEAAKAEFPDLDWGDDD